MLDKFDLFTISYLGKSFDELLASIHNDITQLKVRDGITDSVLLDLLRLIAH